MLVYHQKQKIKEIQQISSFNSIAVSSSQTTTTSTRTALLWMTYLKMKKVNTPTL